MLAGWLAGLAGWECDTMRESAASRFEKVLAPSRCFVSPYGVGLANLQGLAPRVCQLRNQSWAGLGRAERGNQSSFFFF